MDIKLPAAKLVAAAVAGGVATAGIATGAFLYSQRGAADVPAESDPPRIGYAADATMANSGNELQEIADRVAQDKGITLEYSNTAISLDGQTVTCYVANAIENAYDMYFGVYFDSAYEEELYLSQLLRPGTALREITLSRVLEPGKYQIYVVETQVGEIDGVQTIMSQVAHTIDLEVKS